MSLDRLMNQPMTLTRRQPSTTDVYGNEVLGTYGSPITVYGFLEQIMSAETLVDRDTTTITSKAWLPADTQVGILDRITFNGNTYEVVGNPNPWWNPRTKAVSHLTVELIAVVG